MKGVTEINNSDDSDNFINNNSLGIIFFGSENCPHCRNMTSLYEDLVNKYPSVKFSHVETSKVKVDNLDGVPVFVGYKNKEPVDIVIGASPKNLTQMVVNLTN